VAYRFVEHVGEVEVELEARSETGIFEAALTAFAELVGGRNGGEPIVHVVHLTAAEADLLLVDWLSELVFLAEVEGFVPERLSAIEIIDGRLRATVSGRRGEPRHLVKAVTLSKLDLDQREGTWHGRVVLDV
jgi:SHS2 domain-containing protein